MKKRNLLILFAAASMTLAACGEKPSSESASQPDDTGTTATKSTTGGGGDDTPLEDEDVTVAFNAIDNPVMVTEKVKGYIDAMHAQEETLEFPYHLTPLYGPEDYGAGQADQNDGYVYPEDRLGGVDVCQMLSRNDYDNTIENVPVKVSWSKGDLSYKKGEIQFWSAEDKSDLRTVSFSSGTSVNLPNLYRNTTYNYQVFLEGAKRYISQVAQFKTADYVRTITMGGVKNVRDLGGYMTSYGVRTNQGLIYRGYEIIDESFGQHGSNYTAAVEKVNQEVMKIGHEIDLKDDGGRNGRTVSCLEGAEYSPLEVVAYDGFLTSATSLGNIPEIFHLLANADKSHVYFHCWGGADRTGMIGFFLNAILGVSYTDLIIDFELTTETNNKRCHMHNSSNAHFPNFLGAFTKLDMYDPNKTINENCEAWLLANGVAAEDIERIRSIMLPGYSSAMKPTIPSYTYNEATFDSDNVGHWHPANEDAKVRCDYHRHNLHLDAERSVLPDCAHEGHEVYVCDECHKVIEIDSPKSDHNFQQILAVSNVSGKQVTLGECGGCGDREIAISYIDGTTFTGNPAAPATNVSTKMSNDGTTYTSWHINVDKAITGAKIYFEGKTDASSNMARYFFNQNKAVNPVNPITGEEYPDQGDSYPDGEGEAKWRYMVSVNGGEKIAPNIAGTYSEAGCGAGPFYFCDLDLAAGDNEIAIHQMAIGYRLTFSGKVHIRYHSDATIVGDKMNQAQMVLDGQIVNMNLNSRPAEGRKEYLAKGVNLTGENKLVFNVTEKNIDYVLDARNLAEGSLGVDAEDEAHSIKVAEAGAYNIVLDVTEISASAKCITISVVPPVDESGFMWSDVCTEGSFENGKFLNPGDYTLNVPLAKAGTVTLYWTLKGSSGNGTKVMNGSSGQTFTFTVNGVSADFLGQGLTYNEYLGEDQTAEVEVAAATFDVQAGDNEIKIHSQGGYRLSLVTTAALRLVYEA